ncbi:HK97 gp10 family phage protein, partial [Paenibacillus sp. IHBB 10380]
KKRTPVDSGELRRNWRVGRVIRQGSSYVVEIYNNTEYASFVEYGHRNRDKTEWVEGRFMMTISMKQIERELPAYL